MEWEEYKKEALKYRMEYSDVYEYISVLLLGIAEEISEYRSSVYKMQSIEDQVSEYGDLLWNVAELENTLSEIGVKNDVVNINVYDVSLSCVQTVRKHYFFFFKQKTAYEMLP